MGTDEGDLAAFCDDNHVVPREEAHKAEDAIAGDAARHDLARRPPHGLDTGEQVLGRRRRGRGKRRRGRRSTGVGWQETKVCQEREGGSEMRECVRVRRKMWREEEHGRARRTVAKRDCVWRSLERGERGWGRDIPEKEYRAETYNREIETRHRDSERLTQGGAEARDTGGDTERLGCETQNDRAGKRRNGFLCVLVNTRAPTLRGDSRGFPPECK